jgi:ribose transport system ATP-binding protein
MDSKEVLRLESISKAFFGVYAVKDVSFSVNRGEVLGIIGENGAGKSTLMNIIGGVISADLGKLLFKGEPYLPQQPGDATRKGISFIHQELNLFNNLSIVDNIFITNFKKVKHTPFINKKELSRKAKEILEIVDLHISPDILIERLTPGERQLVEIAKELSRNPELVIFDEPTTSLTARETEKLFALINKISAEGIAVIYISHILGDVLNLSHNILVLRDGKVTDTGDVKDFYIDRMILSMVGRDIVQMYPDALPCPREQTMLEIQHLSQPGIVKDINLGIRSGEIVGIFGLMGSGRSELARIIFGLDQYVQGTIKYNGKVFSAQDPVERIRNGFAFITENRREEGLLMEFSVYENICLSSLRRYAKALGVLDRKIEKPVRKSVDELRIKTGNVKKHQVKALSGGNQQKVVIAKWLMTQPSLLIVDEPTRGIDVGAKAEIYTLLNSIASSGTGILAISSELEELAGICNRILVMNRGEIIGEYTSGSFDREKILRTAFRQDKEGKAHEVK